jgi:hypothetical protein
MDDKNSAINVEARKRRSISPTLQAIGVGKKYVSALSG